MFTRKYCLILLIAGLFHRRVDAQDLYEGDSCRLSSGPGMCKRLQNCQVVYNALVTGKRPEKVCGYIGSIPVVCCPEERPIWETAATTTSTTTTRRPTTTSTTSRPPVTSDPLANARPARRMCAEYAKAVYALIDPPTLDPFNTQKVNVSLCAIKAKKLIVGGMNADPKEFPHMVALGYIVGSGVKWNCGGTLISDRYVLTAAHCTYNSEWGKVEWARVGDLNLNSNIDDARVQDFRVAQSTRHPSYRAPAGYNDVALLKLNGQARFDAYVRPACLSMRPTVPTGEKAIATGWGVVDWFDDEGVDNLLKVTLPIVSYQKCQTMYKDDLNKLPNGVNQASQICAGAEGRDTCQGDSGGPLVTINTEEVCMYDVVGVTSFGKLCGSIAPGIYINVYNYLSWIESTVWPSLG